MSTRIVVSPAREHVEVIPDADWLEATGVGEYSLRPWTLARRPVLAALWNHGKFTESSGRATALWHAEAQKYGYAGARTAINAIANDDSFQPAIEQDLRGKRRYSVRIVALPESWFRKLAAEWPAVNGSTASKATRPPVEEPATVEAIPEPSVEDREAANLMKSVIMPESELDLPELPPDEPVEDYAPPIELHVASSVAMALLTQVVEIISSGSPADTDRRIRQLTTDLADASDKLARRLSENDHMRKSIRDLGEEIIALRSERDGLRKRLRAAEINLERATSADAQAFINDRVQDEIAKIMRTTPTSRPLKDDPA